MTWPARATASERREVASHTCMQIWCAAIGIAPCLAACDVAKVKLSITAAERANKRLPVRSIKNDKKIRCLVYMQIHVQTPRHQISQALY